ncbi:MAG: sodium:proton antiporter [Candidatus Eiseniibacteriota bacterium]|nr:MAG: sodium:proton antiporter [Candidatus Eisenbacteria bacterium]
MRPVNTAAFILVLLLAGLFLGGNAALAEDPEAVARHSGTSYAEDSLRRGSPPETSPAETSRAQRSHPQASQGDVSGHDAPHDAAEHNEASHPDDSYLGTLLPLWSALPFIGILLSIALFPLLAPTFWHHNYPKVSLFWALVFAVPFLIVFKNLAGYEILHIYLIDYIPFIILLWGLFTVSGGILLRGKLQGTPALNTLLLLIGTALASWMGTTGAAMLLIRPLLRANAFRKHKRHTIIFFIFLVANIGGSLTPLGDPPLFLGFLHGVPFFWTFKILPHMLLVSGILLALYFVLDTLYYRREAQPAAPETTDRGIRIEGAHNFLFLAGILGAVLLSGNWQAGTFTVLGVHVNIQSEVRDVLILTMGLLSLLTTSQELRRDNQFTWFPIKEVAYLFAGIFMTIIPMLAMLRAGSNGALAFVINAVNEPAHYFWITGALSSFLDNAPTYLTFFNLALGRLQIPAASVTAVLSDPAVHEGGRHFVTFLKAISAGAVFFGANTYIGNAPNFMVRAIAEENKVPMPSFFGYMLWSTAILVPVFLLVTLKFF